MYSIIAAQIAMWCIFIHWVVDIKLFSAWYNWFQYFTIQSNFLVLVFCVLYLLDKKKHFLTTNNLQIYITAYISITGLVYCGLLLPFGGGDSIFDNASFWIFNVLAHVFVPLATVIVFFLQKYIKQTKQLYNILKTIGYGMIYPVVYLIYAVILPFISNDKTVYGFFTDLKSNPLAVLYIIAAAVLFAIVIYLYCLYNRRFILKIQTHKRH